MSCWCLCSFFFFHFHSFLKLLPLPLPIYFASNKPLFISALAFFIGMGGDMYPFDKNLSSHSQDEISLFLRQIILRSSSSPSSHSMPGSCNSNATHHNINVQPSLIPSPFQDAKISPLDSTASGACSFFKGHRASSSAANVSTSSVGVSENENDDYDCESEVYITLLCYYFFSTLQSFEFFLALLLLSRKCFLS